MKTKEQRESDFRNDLELLLKKHNAEIDITDSGCGYGQHIGVCEISMQVEFDENGNKTAEYTEFRL